MTYSKKHSGFAIALAWPETKCKQAGAWYDMPLYYLGINRKGYYRVGHAAIVLIDYETRICRYFDFGRYHAPHGHGRVRSFETDPDLKINTSATINNDKSCVSNLDKILIELAGNNSTHGDGPIHGAITRINYESALTRVKELQEKESIPYGPFIPHGTNCSRFVNSVLQAGRLSVLQKILLYFPLTISPTPFWNLKALAGKIYVFDPFYQTALDIPITIKPELVG